MVRRHQTKATLVQSIARADTGRTMINAASMAQLTEIAFRRDDLQIGQCGHLTYMNVSL
jgi:hypothetical protein